MNGGRPSSYRSEYAEQAKKLCELGATDSEMADFFDVHRSTLYRWKLEYPEFCDALKVGKEAADNRAERSLYQKATGYTYLEQQAFKVKTVTYDAGKRVKEVEEVRVVEVERVAPPDTTACIFWLKNRRAADWRDKALVEHSGEITHNNSHMRDEIARELDKHAAEGEAGRVARVAH